MNLKISQSIKEKGRLRFVLLSVFEFDRSSSSFRWMPAGSSLLQPDGKELFDKQAPHSTMPLWANRGRVFCDDAASVKGEKGVEHRTKSIVRRDYVIRADIAK